MDSSRLSKLKQDWRMAVEYGAAFDYHIADAWLPVRDELFESGFFDEEIKEIDRQAIIRAVKEGSDRANQRDHEGLERWWWHLEKIAGGEYPVELLPEYLREIYLKAQRGEF